MLHWSIFLAGVAFAAIASTQASVIEKFAGGYSSESGEDPGLEYTCDCGSVNDDIRDAGRIINGTKVQQESKYPFIVSLRNADTDQHDCGGSIITPLHILTAAHCVSDYKVKDEPDVRELIVAVGVHKRSQDASHDQTQKLEVEEAHIPDEWYDSGSKVLNGDLAVLVLKTPIDFSKWVGPVCLTPEMPPITNEYIKVMGWGRTETGKSRETLRETNLLALGQHCTDDETKVCFEGDGTYTCNGDSGGPFVYLDPETKRYTQVSLVSHDKHGCKGMDYGTNVVHYYQFIQDVVAANSEGYGICQKINQEK